MRSESSPKTSRMGAVRTSCLLAGEGGMIFGPSVVESAAGTLRRSEEERTNSQDTRAHREREREEIAIVCHCFLQRSALHFVLVAYSCRRLHQHVLGPSRCPFERHVQRTFRMDLHLGGESAAEFHRVTIGTVEPDQPSSEFLFGMRAEVGRRGRP